MCREPKAKRIVIIYGDGRFRLAVQPKPPENKEEAAEVVCTLMSSLISTIWNHIPDQEEQKEILMSVMNRALKIIGEEEKYAGQKETPPVGGHRAGGKQG